MFNFSPHTAQGFIDSIFTLVNSRSGARVTPASAGGLSPSTSRLNPTRGEIAHLVIDSTGLKVFGEGEWKAKKDGQEKRSVWRKLHLTVGAGTHEVICVDLSLNNVTDAEAFPGLIRKTHRKVKVASADGAYNTKLGHDELWRKKSMRLSRREPSGLLAGGVC